MLQFEQPWAWLLAAPAVWLLWRRRHAAPSRVVPNLFLWVGRADAAATSGRTVRRRPPWLFWVQAAAFVTTAAAAAGPAVVAPRADAALILDASLSAGARAGSTTRLDELRAAAQPWLDAQPSGARVRLIVAGVPAREAGDWRAGSVAFSTVAPAAGPADFGGAITLARDATAGRIAIVADRPAPPGIDTLGLEWITAGSPAPNVGITRAVRPSSGEIIVDVANAGGTAVDAALSIDDARLPLRLEPGERTSVRQFVVPFATGRDVTVRVEAPPALNALTADDARTLAPPARIGIRADPAVPRAALLAVQALPQVTISTSSGALALCLACTGIDGPRLQVGGRGPAQPGQPARTVRIDAIDHPLFEGVAFDDVLVRVTASPTDRSGWMTLASVDGTPFIEARDVAHARAVRVNADLEDPGLAGSPAWPIVVANAIRWIAEQPREGIDHDATEQAAESDLISPPAPDTRNWPGITQTPAHPRVDWTTETAWLALMLIGLEMALARRVSAAAITAGVALAAMMWPLRLPAGRAPRTVVFALDGSSSVSAARAGAVESIRGDLAAMTPGDHAGVVVFGGAPLDTRAPAPAPVLDARRLPPAGAATNIASGIDAALRLMSGTGDRRVVLLTDGFVTAGDAPLAIDRARDRGVTVDVVPLSARSLAVTRVDAPATAREGVPVTLRVEATGPPGGHVSLTLARDGADVRTVPLAFDSTGRSAVTLSDVPSGRGLVFYRASIVDAELGVALSEGGAAVEVTGPASVLLVSDGPSGFDGRFGQARVTRVPPAALSSGAATLARHDVIVIDGVTPSRLTEPQRAAIDGAVSTHGAGLLFIGRATAADAAGFPASAFTSLLPFDFAKAATPPGRTRALALVVDTSGSMATTAGGVVKIAAASDAIARALAVIPPSDIVEVIGFASQPAVLLPAGAPRSPSAIAAALAGLRPSGSTAIAPAVEAAVRFLSGAAVESRRLVLLSDGRTNPADADATRKAIAGRGVALSVVSTGDDSELGWLSRLAQESGGATYTPASLQTLPEDVAHAALEGSTGRVINARFTVRVRPHVLTDALTAPALGGYVSAALRLGAEAVWRAPNGDGVFAVWPRGLGRVAALASDLAAPWGTPLAGWPAGTAFWPRLLGWLSRASGQADAEFLSTPDGPRLTVVVPAADHAGGPLPRVVATVADPDGRTENVPLSAINATRFEGPVTLARTGEYRAVITAGDARLTRGWFWSGDEEGRASGWNGPALEGLAARGGGALAAPAPAPSGVFAAPRQRGVALPGWMWLTLATAALVFGYARRGPQGARA